MLGYRTLFSVDGGDVVERAHQQLYSWLRDKGYDADALEAGATVSLADGVECTLLDNTAQDGSRSVRARLTEDKSNDQRWTSQLTVHVPGRTSQQPWVWVDIDTPEDDSDEFGKRPRRWTGTPKLVRNLLEVFQAADGQARLGPRPQTMTADDAETLLDIVCDPDRRGPVFLAGGDTEIPVASWKEHVDPMLAETVGLAGTYVLTSDATAAFNTLIGETHSVAPGTVRTYLPCADPADPLDAPKHRVLSTGRILRDDPKNIRRMLGRKARELTIEAPLSKAATRIDARFERDIDNLLVNALIPTPRRDSTRTTRATHPENDEAQPIHGSTSVVDSNPAPPDSEPTVDTAPQVGPETEGYLALRELLLDVTGFDDINPMTVDELGRLARAGRNAEQQSKALQRRFEELQYRNTVLREDQDRLTKRLETEQLDHYQTDEERADLQEQLRRLRLSLARNGRAEQAWDDDVTDVRTVRPKTFDDLIEGLQDEFPRLVFTGDKSKATALDEHEPLGRWAAKTWEALQALDDYAVASADGRCSKGVHDYLAGPPDGCRTFSVNRHARDESETVRSTEKYAKHRTLPVPAEVAAEEAVFMGAHFKIAQSGLTSPRVHYYDDTARSSTVYVGYIGPHLPTPQTN